LRDKDCEFILQDDRISITVLAGEIHLYRQLRHPLEHELGHQSSVPAGPAGGYRDFGQLAQFFR
jgi:hypothetical protein